MIQGQTLAESTQEAIGTEPANTSSATVIVNMDNICTEQRTSYHASQEWQKEVLSGVRYQIFVIVLWDQFRFLAPLLLDVEIQITMATVLFGESHRKRKAASPASTELLLLNQSPIYHHTP